MYQVGKSKRKSRQTKAKYGVKYHKKELGSQRNKEMWY